MQKTGKNIKTTKEKRKNIEGDKERKRLKNWKDLSKARRGGGRS